MHRTSFRVLMSLFLALIAGACQAQAGTNASITPITLSMTVPASASLSSTTSAITIDWTGHTASPFSVTYSFNGNTGQHGYIETYLGSATSALQGATSGFSMSAAWLSLQVGAGSFVACGSAVSVAGNATNLRTVDVLHDGGQRAGMLLASRGTTEIR